MKVTYNSKTKKFSVVFLDPLKKFLGDKHPYRQKSKGWQSPFPPNQTQQRNIKKELLKLAEEEIKKAELEVELLIAKGEVKEQITNDDLEGTLIPISSFRPIIKRALMEAVETVNWERFIDWEEVYRHIELFILERVKNPNEDGEEEIFY